MEEVIGKVWEANGDLTASVALVIVRAEKVMAGSKRHSGGGIVSVWQLSLARPAN